MSVSREMYGKSAEKKKRPNNRNGAQTGPVRTAVATRIIARWKRERGKGASMLLPSDAQVFSPCGRKRPLLVQGSLVIWETRARSSLVAGGGPQEGVEEAGMYCGQLWGVTAPAMPFSFWRSSKKL